MESSFALVGFAANSFSTRSREVTLGTSRYQIPRSGLVQTRSCRIVDHVGLVRTVAVLDYVGGHFELEQSDMIFPPFS